MIGIVLVASRRHAWFFTAFLLSVLDCSAQVPNPAIPVGEITAQLPESQSGGAPALSWTTRLPDVENPANYTHYIRQVAYPESLVHDTIVASSGQMQGQPLGTTGSRYELWCIRLSPMKALLVAETICSGSLPSASVTIRSADPYPYLPRTRADKPFQVDIAVQGLLDDPEAPEPSRSVTLQKTAQSYGAAGIGDDIDRSAAVILNQTAVNANGSTTLAIPSHSLPGDDSMKVRGEQRFSILTIGSLSMPASVIASQFIQIWPVADAAIEGIAAGQTIGPETPLLTFHLNDLYPSSTTYAQIYKGSPRVGVVGRVIPDSTFVINTSTPQSRVATKQDYLSLFDSDGIWTMEIVTETPFGSDRIACVSFTVQGTGTIRENWRLLHFGSTSNSGDGADLFDYDHDGIPNLVEFAFGMDPTHADNVTLPAAQLTGNQLMIDFTQPSGVGGVTYEAEWNAGLSTGDWAPVSNSSTPPRYTFKVPTVGRQAAFMRLKVTGQ